MRDRRFLVEKKLQKNGWAGLADTQASGNPRI